MYSRCVLGYFEPQEKKTCNFAWDEWGKQFSIIGFEDTPFYTTPSSKPMILKTCRGSVGTVVSIQGFETTAS